MSVRIEAVPAIHAIRRALGRLVGNGNGYALTLSADGEEARIYVTGDGVFGPEMRGVLTRFRPQVVIANAGAAHVGTGRLARAIGRITMCAADLLELAASVPEATVVPVHYGTFSHYLDPMVPAGPRFLSIAPGSAIDLPGESPAWRHDKGG
jgi:L-ascorbate metabolism protein UlaG (beta-lactamase superfamily)